MVKFLEPEACTEGQDKDESVTVGVTFFEKVDPCLLADPFVVSGWVKTELSAVESVKASRLVRRCSAVDVTGLLDIAASFSSFHLF